MRTVLCKCMLVRLRLTVGVRRVLRLSRTFLILEMCDIWSKMHIGLPVKYPSSQADHSSRGVLPTVVRRCVWSRNLVNEEALAHGGCRAKKKKKYILSPQVFERYSARKFHDKPSGGSRTVACGQTDRHEMKLIVTFRNIANASKDYVALKRRRDEIPCRRDNHSKNQVLGSFFFHVPLARHLIHVCRLTWMVGGSNRKADTCSIMWHTWSTYPSSPTVGGLWDHHVCVYDFQLLNRLTDTKLSCKIFAVGYQQVQRRTLLSPAIGADMRTSELGVKQVSI